MKSLTGYYNAPPKLVCKCGSTKYTYNLLERRHYDEEWHVDTSWWKMTAIKCSECGARGLKHFKIAEGEQGEHFTSK